MAPTAGGQGSLPSLSVPGVIPARQRCAIHACGSIKDMWAMMLNGPRNCFQRDTLEYLFSKRRHTVLSFVSLSLLGIFKLSGNILFHVGRIQDGSSLFL